MTKQGISRNALARATGVSPRAITKAITSGLLTPALLPDNTLSPDLARHLLVTGITGVRSDEPSDLTLARKRKTRASIRKTYDEILLLESKYASIDKMREFAQSEMKVISVRLRRIPGEAAKGVVGLSPAAACEHVRTVVYVALNDLANEWDVEPPFDDLPADDDGPLVGNSVQLAARLTNLQAARLEAQSEIKAGSRVNIDAYVDAHDRRIGNCRQLMIAMPTKLAAMIASTTSEDEAREMITREVNHAVMELKA